MNNTRIWLTIEVLEVGQLDAFPHAQNVGSSADAIEHHPQVSGIERGNGVRGRICSISNPSQRMLNIRPGRNDRAGNHQSEGKEGHWRDGTSEPQNLSICDQDDCEILEYSVNRDREELKRLGAGVNHADEKEGDGKPYAVLVHVCFLVF